MKKFKESRKDTIKKRIVSAEMTCITGARNGIIDFSKIWQSQTGQRLKKREENKSKGVDGTGDNFMAKVFQWLEILLELVLLSISFHFDKQIEQKRKKTQTKRK